MSSLMLSLHIAAGIGQCAKKVILHSTLSSIKYTHPLFSIFLPLPFLVMGGIGLPEGAVYIETWRLKNRDWVSAVSLAGPISNLLLAIVLSIVLNVAPVSENGIWPGLAFLAYLQIMAVILNLIPVPPDDNFSLRVNRCRFDWYPT